MVARWRADVDYVAAGIYCFQPYCITGELDPPANPLICPQFSVRFNDLDNIGLTGRHYSGFVMLGIQVFNYPNDFKFFKDECVEFNYRWLTEELGIDPNEITFIEDVWAGGGNCGPCIEYFIGGLEIGNMVFMQYKTFHDGSREELAIKVIDTGIGLERIPWLINGSATSYMDTFNQSLKYITKLLDIKLDTTIWEKFGPYSCLLNIDEVDDIEKTWETISKLIGEEQEKVKLAISPIKDIYIILDHIRTVFMIINDGSLPSNVGGGSNVRNILRRMFSLLKKYGWDQKIKIKEMIDIIDCHIQDMELIYGKLIKNPNLAEILQIEYDRWVSTDSEQKSKLNKLITKKGKLEIDDWIIAIQSYGIPADIISEIAKIPIPGNLYYEIALREEQICKVAEQILYDTSHLAETDAMFYQDHHMNQFKGEIIEVLKNVEKGEMKGKNNIVILNQSGFYPNSGGQANDKGWMTIEGIEYEVINVEKVGKCALHILNKELPGEKSVYIGKEVEGRIDTKRRMQLMSHHTATHIVFAACKRVLGPHVWQNGAKKTEEVAHLDITHYKSLTFEEELKIQNMANQIIMEGHKINKSYINKAEAEKSFGFTLYQGGVVPGNVLRVVNIDGVDVEACCGTHHDNTSQVGWIKIIKSKRISDGIVRLYYVAYEKTLAELNTEARIINDLSILWGIERGMIVDTASRFFSENKKMNNKLKNQSTKLISYEMQSILSEPQIGIGYVNSDEDNCQIYFSNCPSFVPKLKSGKKGIIYYNENFIYVLIGDKSLFNEQEFKAFCEGMKGEAKDAKVKYSCQETIAVNKKEKVKDVYQISVFMAVKVGALKEYFTKLGFKEIS